jgi:hypothetical protein
LDLLVLKAPPVLLVQPVRWVLRVPRAVLAQWVLLAPLVLWVPLALSAQSALLVLSV